MALRCARRLLKQVFGGCFSQHYDDDEVYDEESLAPGPRNAQYFLRDSCKFSGPLDNEYFGASTGKAVVIGPADDEGYDYRKSPMPFWARMLLLLFVACSTANDIVGVPAAFTKLLPPKPKVKEQTGSSSDDEEDEEAFLIRAGHRPTALVLPPRALSSVEFLVVCSGSGLAMDTLAGIGFDAPTYSTNGMRTPGMQTMLLLSGAMRPAATGLPLPPATPVDEEVLPPHLRLLLHLHATASSLFTAPTAHNPRPYSPVGPGPTQSTRAAYSLQVQEVDSAPPSPRPSHGCCSPPPCPPSPTPELPLSPRAHGPRTSRPSSPAAALALRLSPWPEFSSSSSSSSSASRSPSWSPRAVPCVVQQEEPAASAAPSSPALSMGLREVDASDLLASFTNSDPHKATNSAASCCTSPRPTPLSPESTMASSSTLLHQQQQQQPGGLESFSSLSHLGPVLAEEGMAALQQLGQQQAEEEEEEATQPLLLPFELESVDRCHVIASPLLTMVEGLLDDDEEEEEEQQQAAGLCSVDVLESVSLGADTTGAMVPLHHLQPLLQEEPGLGAAAAFELKVLDCRALLGGGSTFSNPTEPIFEDEQLLVVAVQWRGRPRPEVAAEKVLGVGGFAEVRLVGPKQGYDRRYALKLVDLQQFLREGEDGGLRLSCTAEELQMEPLLLAQLARHMDQSADEPAFAIRQYGWGVCGPFLFSLQEVAEAGSLKAFEGELADLAALQYVFASMVRALHALLLFGWLHCDVKPGNVLVTRDGQLKLADFNTSVEVWRAEQGHVLASYTEDFAPPEVRRDDLLPADGRADVFGVGATVAKLQNSILKGLLLKPPAKAVREAIKGAMRNLEGGAKVPPRYSYEQLLAMDWLADCPPEAPPTFLSLVDEVCAKADDSMAAEGVQGA